MSTDTLTTTPPASSTIDTARPGVPLLRLVGVECRKLVDTRAGFWLAGAIVIVSVLVTAGVLVFGEPADLTFGALFGLMNLPIGFLLPVLAILLVTSEWSQRSAMVTFTLEPRRSRVVTAKLLTSLVAAVGAVVVALAFAAVGTALAGLLSDGDGAGAWTITAAGLVQAVIVQLFALLLGFAFAMLLMNSPAAIVLYFVLPSVWTIVAAVVPWLQENVQEWADFTGAQAPLMTDQWATGDEWLRIATSGSIWLVLPLVLGVVRLLRSEVK